MGHSKNLIGRALFSSDWETVELEGTILSQDGENPHIDGFNLIAARGIKFCECGALLEDARFTRCAACSFLFQNDMTYEHLHKLRTRKAQRKHDRTIFKDLGRVGRLDEKQEPLSKRIYSFVKYRLEHKPQSFYRGANNPNSKLTEAAVLDIRENYAPMSGASTWHFSRKYGVSQAAVVQAVHGSTWKHVGGTLHPWNL